MMLYDWIANATLIPNNATNRDVARKIFGSYVAYAMEQDAIQNGENPEWWDDQYETNSKPARNHSGDEKEI